MEWLRKVNSQKVFFYLEKSERAIQQATSRIKRAAGLTLYWSAVLTVGIVITGITLHLTHVPLIPVAYAADPPTWLITILGNLLYYGAIGPIGALTVVVAFILEIVISYPYGGIWTTLGSGGGGGFVNVSAVITGWKLVRDVCNIFFSLILVVIALATVLKIEAYSWKVMLPKFVLMAVFINFSKTIAGVFTDLATVAMATFGGSFAGKFSSGLIGAFGLPTVTGLLSAEGSTQSSAITTLLAFGASVTMTVVFFVVIVVFTATLVFRIVMLWFLIVLSPLAYITRILPQTEKYSKQWWEKFGKYVVVGPLVTFFLWLSLSMAFGTGEIGGEDLTNSTSGNPLTSGFSTITEEDARASGVPLPPSSDFASASPNVLANFLIATMMLMASLKIIHEMAGEIGGMLGKLEGAAWGAGATLAAYPGRLMEMFGSTVGREPVYDKEEKFGLGRFTAKALGRTATFLGTTVFSPVDFMKGKYEGIRASSAEKKRNARQQAAEKIEEMQGEEILGHGFLRGLGGLLSVSMGVVAGAGVDGKHVFDQWLSGGGAWRLMKKGILLMEGREKDIAKLKEEEKNLTEEHNKSLQRLKEEETNDAIANHTALGEAMKKKWELAQHIVESERNPKIDVQLDLNSPEILAVIEQQMAALRQDLNEAQAFGETDKADRLKKQIDGINKSLADAAKGKKATISSQDLFSKIGDVKTLTKEQQEARKEKLRDLLVKNIGDRLNFLQGIRKNVADRLTATGYDVEKSIWGATKNYATDKEREDLKKAAYLAKAESMRLANELATYEAGMNYETRTHTQKLVSEEMQKIQGIRNSNELAQYLQRAIREKNSYLAEACLRRITQNYDENEVFQQMMAHDPEANSGADGMENYRKKILMGQLGMTEEQSIRLMNDLSYMGEETGHLGIARKYTMEAGRWEILTERKRIEAMTAEQRKLQPSTYVIRNRLGWGDEDQYRDFKLNDGGLNLLRFGGEDMADIRNWARMNPNAKLNLSNPKSIERMRQAGVSPKLIGLLQSYWEASGQYQGVGTPLAGNLSRFAISF